MRASLAVSLGACVLLSGVVPTARADVQADYDAAIKTAIAEYDAGNWDEARAMFLRAHQIKPNARALRGMGLADFEARHYVRAIKELRDALAEARNPLTDAQRASVEAAIARAESYLARVIVLVHPENAAIHLDGRSVTPGPGGEIAVDAGTHELRVSAEGYEPQSVRVSLVGGEQSELRIKLFSRAAGASPATPATSPTPGPAPAPVAAEGSGGGQVWTWVAAGGAVVFAGGALAFWLAGDAELQRVRDRCAAQGGCLDRDAELHASSVRTWDTLTIVSASLAAASALTAGVLLLVPGDAPDQTTAERPRIEWAISPVGVTAVGRF